MAERQRGVVIRQFIVENVHTHPTDIATLTRDSFGITKQAVSQHIKHLVEKGVLSASGKTSRRSYELRSTGHTRLVLQTAGLQEDIVWREHVKPLIENAPKNVLDTCNLAFSEMLNNAIDHSGSETVVVEILCTAATISMKITDMGIGIFKKVKEAYNLSDERESILELTKGKLTTSPTAHSGYGIPFTSRMVDVFSLSSGQLFFTHIKPDDAWLIESGRSIISGTHVECLVSMSSTKSPNDVYDKFCGSAEDSDMSYSKTHVPIRLAQYGNEKLVSRSQAKRVLSRFDKFEEVCLDFQGVDFIGQAFADEIFRVFRILHPNIKLTWLNVNKQVHSMIRLAISTGGGN